MVVAMHYFFPFGPETNIKTERILAVYEQLIISGMILYFVVLRTFSQERVNHII